MIVTMMSTDDNNESEPYDNLAFGGFPINNWDLVGLTNIEHKKMEKSSNSLIDKLVKSVKAIKSGKLHIEIQDKSAIDIVATSGNNANRINIDIIEPDLFDFLKGGISDSHEDKGLPNGKENESSVNKILDKLDGAKEFIHSMTDKESSFQQQLDLAKNFAHTLTENNMTLVLMRRGKEAMILGKEAKPTLSKIISGSDDLQVVSVIESSKLIGDINPES